MFPINFITALLFLGYFTYLDIKYKEIDNNKIIMFGAVSFFFFLISNQKINYLILITLLFLFCYLLWQFKCIGGADVKIIPLLIPFFNFNGFAEGLVYTFFFIIILSIISLIYIIINYIQKIKKDVGYLIIITITFIITYIIKTIN